VLKDFERLKTVLFFHYR